MSHLLRTIPALAATALALAACGDAGGDGTATTSAADRDAARLRFEQCMRRNGVDLGPTTSRASGSGAATRIDRDSAAVRAATQKCAKYRTAAFGEITDEQRQEFRDAFAKFSSCMRKQGVDVPAPPAAGGGSGGAGAIVRQRIDSSPKSRAAMEACRKNLPQSAGAAGGGPVVAGPGLGAADR
jgi:hypothetical protein